MFIRELICNKYIHAEYNYVGEKRCLILIYVSTLLYQNIFLRGFCSLFTTPSEVMVQTYKKSWHRRNRSREGSGVEKGEGGKLTEVGVKAEIKSILNRG